MSKQPAKKKRAKSKTTMSAKWKLVKKTAGKKLRKKPASKKKASSKKTIVKTKVLGKKAVGAKAATIRKKRASGSRETFSARTPGLGERRARSAGQSGDSQGLSNVEAADSESVEELIGEGNAFEADVVAGVESAGDREGKEVRTHEVLEDDVPGEYLDKDP